MEINVGQIIFETANNIPPWCRVSTGSKAIDTILKGGIPINGITEIYGESGVGKTQLALQLALTVQLNEENGGRNKGAVYICTDDIFPSKRFNQLSSYFKERYACPHLAFENNVYLEHSADSEQLKHLLRVRLPNLLKIKNIGMLVIDSIAGTFRSENDGVNYTSRGKDIHEIASILHSLVDKHEIAVICINQVTSNPDSNQYEPCLGLAWSNNVTYRCRISRSIGTIRDFEVIFTPDLPNVRCLFDITPTGIN